MSNFKDNLLYFFEEYFSGLLGIGFLAFLSLAVIFFIYVFVVYTQWRHQWHKNEKLLNNYYNLIETRKSTDKITIASIIYDRHNRILGSFYKQRRQIITLKDLPNGYINILIAIEDRKFFRHNGVDYKAMFRAFFKNIFALSIKQGGSTITQQLAKLLFTHRQRTIKRKIMDIFSAYAIEDKYNKKQILTMYINLVYMGHGAYGLKEAANTYFMKDISQLSIAEFAFLIGLISNPGYYSPYRHYNISKKRHLTVLKILESQNLLKKGQAATLHKNFWDKYPDKSYFSYLRNNGNFAPYVKDYLWLSLKKKYPKSHLNTEGWRIYTTIDFNFQRIAQKILYRSILKQKLNYIQKGKYYLKRLDFYHHLLYFARAQQLNGALITADVHSGEILSMVGGFKYSKRNQLNRVISARRQVGSAFKPIIYALAIDKLNVNPFTVMIDEKTEYGNKFKYIPKNYDRTYRGDITLYYALIYSVNTIAVKLFSEMGTQPLYHYLTEILGKSMKKRFKPELGVAIGQMSFSPYELLQLLLPIGNKGKYVKLHILRNIKMQEKTISIKRNEPKELLSEYAANTVKNMLKGVLIQGTAAGIGADLIAKGYNLAGKTGTTDNSRDAWFVGFFENTITVVWVGMDKYLTLGHNITGGVIAAPIWQDYISSLSKYIKPSGNSFEKITLCKTSGKMEGECNEDEEVINTYIEKSLLE